MHSAKRRPRDHRLGIVPDSEGTAMTGLDGLVAIITGAGRGLGREHALLFARLGCRVVVNDYGGTADGAGNDAGPAHEVVSEITAAGGTAVANTDNVASWDGAQRLIDSAISEFGELNVLVNNAGILRDRTIVNMSEAEWRSVIEVHLTGHFFPLRFAAVYWRDRSKAGQAVSASVVNTTSGSGLFGNPGQVNYASAKAGIATMTLVGARELQRYGVRVNAIAPVARTRLTEAAPGIQDLLRAPDDAAQFDPWDPANISPLVAYLASRECHVTGQVFNINGSSVALDSGWAIAEKFTADGRWDVTELAATLKHLPSDPPPLTRTT
jgi:NAD(P)-dependent dehydrogenase (short-subunit alcohol dehydrogenase family)